MSEAIKPRNPEEPASYIENVNVAHNMANAMVPEMDRALASKEYAHELRNTEVPEHDEDDYGTDGMAEQQELLDEAAYHESQAELHTRLANEAAQKVWDSREEEEEEVEQDES